MNTIGSRGTTLIKMARPRIVCLCGSTRFKAAFEAANMTKTLDGEIVLSVGSYHDDDTFAAFDADTKRTIKAKLDVLHFRKIDLADYIFVLNLEGYVGESVEREIEYARSLGKPVKFLEDTYDTPRLLRALP
jgi:hypothetical protein